MSGTVLSAAAHAAMIGAAAYGLPWLERRDGGPGTVVAATLVAEEDFAAVSKLGRPDADSPVEPNASPSATPASGPLEPPIAPEPEPVEHAPPEPPTSPQAAPAAIDATPEPPGPSEPTVLAAPDPVTPPEAAAPEVPRAPPGEQRPLPRPKRPQGRGSAEPSPPPSPGDAGRSTIARPGSQRGGGPGSDVLMNATKAAVRAELVRAQGLVERARERARGVTGDPLLEMTISRDGRLENARVLRSSGSAVVDAASLRAARAARRYPAAPEGLPGRHFVSKYGSGSMSGKGETRSFKHDY